MLPSLHRTGLKALKVATCHFISAESFCQNDSTSAMWCVSKNRNKHGPGFMAWKIRYWKLNCYKFSFYLKNNRKDMKNLRYWSSPLQRPILMLLENVSWISDSVSSREILLPKSHDPAWKSQVSYNMFLRVNVNIETVNFFFFSGCCQPLLRNLHSSIKCVSMDLFFFLSPSPCCGSGRAVLCPPVSTCRGTKLPPATEKSPLPVAISGKATVWDKLCGTQLQGPAPSQTVMGKRSYQSRVRNTESLREGTPAPAPFQLCPSDTRVQPGVLGVSSLSWTQLWWTSPFPAHMLWFWPPCWEGIRLPGGRRPFPLAGTSHLDPESARNGLIWCKALACGNRVTELVLGQVLHLPSGKSSVSWATAVPELAEGPPALPHVADSPPPCRAPLCHL